MVGRTLKAAREAAGLKARELDRLAGITEGHTSFIENGKIANPSTDTARALAHVLGLSLDYLLSGVGSPPTEGEIRTAVASAQRRKRRAAKGAA